MKRGWPPFRFQFPGVFHARCVRFFIMALTSLRVLYELQSRRNVDQGSTVQSPSSCILTCAALTTKAAIHPRTLGADNQRSLSQPHTLHLRMKWGLQFNSGGFHATAAWNFGNSFHLAGRPVSSNHEEIPVQPRTRLRSQSWSTTVGVAITTKTTIYPRALGIHGSRGPAWHLWKQCVRCLV
jgi:hypothetical protein